MNGKSETRGERGTAEHFDVGIIGGGLAGNLLARQLTRTIPGLTVGVFEKSTERTYKVGESSVEIGSNYLIRRQGLSRYLYEHHLPKNGLRYFFDDEDRGTPLDEMSEIGTVNFPFHPGFQVDRLRLETDLLRWNAEAGVTIEQGVRVRDVEVATGGAEHSFEVQPVDGAGDGSGPARRVRCTYLVDAAGRAGVLARKLDLRTKEEEHKKGAVWGRFEGIHDADELGDESFRGRVRHTCRSLSTMHFWYPGYWVWFIPLRDGITSIGAVGDLPTRERGIRDADGFQEFLRGHRAIGQLMNGARALDTGSYTQIAYGTKRFFHPDRWALVGEAATAADPLYSPGLDFIALENDFVTDWIRRERSGEDTGERLDRYERFMQFRHQAVMRLYRGAYDLAGSYELMRLKWDFDIACYYNLWVQPYFRDQYLCADFLEKQLRQAPYILKALENFANVFREVEQHVRDRGVYHRSNLGEFSHGLDTIDFLEEVGLDRSERQIRMRTERIFNSVRRHALMLLDRPAPEDEPARPLAAFTTDRPIL